MKKSLLVLALLFSLVSFAQSPVDKSFPPEELFALGSYYYPEQWDSSQWERDLKKMSEMGIKFTHFAEFAWAMIEPEEGKYDFEWLDRAVSLADKYGLKVIMCTPTPTPPVWLSKKYPDILIQRDNGISIQHGRRQHASWSSDRYRRYVENIVSCLAMRYGNHPAVIGWQIDNEPGHYGVVDYSENAQAKFRVWLQKKYGTIDKLNDTWGTSFWSETYQNFEQIRLPNQQEVPDKANPHAMLDLNRFMADELAGFVNMQALSTAEDPDAASLPFDKRRCGFVIGEGAVALILEEYGHAKARGAKIYGEVCGYGSTCDAFHITSPAEDGSGAAKAMELAMEGKFGTIAVMKNGRLDYATLEDVVGNNKEIGAVSGNTPESNLRKVTMDDDLVKTARDIGICLGD